MEQKTWLITGCSSGLGMALARVVLARGDRVVATARELQSVQMLRESWPERCRVARLDVTDAGQISEVVAFAKAEFGGVDVLVNNAGYGLVGSVEACSEAQMERNFAVNFFGPLRLMRAVLPLFRAQGRGHIVNISAAAAIANYAGFGIYGASKWALEGVSEALQQEARGAGVRVTLVEPGPFRTDFIGRSLDRVASELPEYAGTAGKFAAFLQTMDGKQPGDPERAAEAIVAAVEAQRPPLRLVLGRYAVEKVRRVAAQREQELKTWEAVGLSADAPAPAAGQGERG